MSKIFLWQKLETPEEVDQAFKAFYGGYKMGIRLRLEGDRGGFTRGIECKYDPRLEAEYDDNIYTNRDFFYQLNDKEYRKDFINNNWGLIRYFVYKKVKLERFNNIWE